ncbi:MAG TPA: hypothetical protein VEG32_08585 [Clostridia bacterium]|nr:hypothetical protein [Clostridia bacterium]
MASNSFQDVLRTNVATPRGFETGGLAGATRLMGSQPESSDVELPGGRRTYPGLLPVFHLDHPPPATQPGGTGRE